MSWVYQISVGLVGFSAEADVQAAGNVAQAARFGITAASHNFWLKCGKADPFSRR